MRPSWCEYWIFFELSWSIWGLNDLYNLILSKTLLIVKVGSRAQPDITSGSGCPDSGLPIFFLPRLRTFNTFKVQEKP